MTGAHEQVRPLLAARGDELSGVQSRWLADHLAECPACVAEAATYGRLFRGLAAMAALDVEPPAGLLDRLLATIARRRHGTLMMAAAGSAGALVAGVVVARAIQQRRRTALLRLTKPANPVTAVLAPIVSDGAKGGARIARIGRVGRWWRLRPA